jgi:DNA-binding NarL/FixJ family response regulator
VGLSAAAGQPMQALAAPAMQPARLLSAPAPLAGPDELSARELEILRLLSAGLTNREIAERLIVSVNDVFPISTPGPSPL